MNLLSNVSWIGIFVTLISILVLGFSWYHWSLFGKTWATSLGMNKEQADNTEGMGKVFLFSIVGAFIKVLFFAVLVEVIGVKTITFNTLLALSISFAMIATSIVYHDGFARRLNKASIVNVSHDIVELTLIGFLYSLFT